MFEAIALIHMSVRILRFWCFLYDSNWRRYICLPATTFMLFTQFYYMFRTSEGINAIIRNSYMVVLWFNAILRAHVLLHNREKYENLLADLEQYYYELKASMDLYVKSLLADANATGKIMARGNIFLGILTSIGFVSYPFFTTERVLPFGSMIPGVNEYASPFYEFWYVYQRVIMCKALQYRLRKLGKLNETDSEVHRTVVACILYQKRIINYILTVDSSGQAVIVCVYITMIFAQILTLYWYANELREQNLAIAVAAYDTQWFTFKIPVQKHILLLILRAQKPCSITLGNTYPMTLELFQALLNASYSYFTLLKRVYG